jgi:hypothetical protein
MHARVFLKLPVVFGHYGALVAFGTQKVFRIGSELFPAPATKLVQ